MKGTTAIILLAAFAVAAGCTTPEGTPQVESNEANVTPTVASTNTTATPSTNQSDANAPQRVSFFFETGVAETATGNAFVMRLKQDAAEVNGTLGLVLFEERLDEIVANGTVNMAALTSIQTHLPSVGGRFVSIVPPAGTATIMVYVEGVALEGAAPIYALDTPTASWYQVTEDPENAEAPITVVPLLSDILRFDVRLDE